MRNFILITIVFLFGACGHEKSPAKAQAVVSASNIIAKFKNTPLSKRKLLQGASDYLDTTFKHDLFVIKDTVSEIRVDNKGRPYIILGKTKNHQDVKCYFVDDKTIDSLKVNQVITVSSKSHAAEYKSMKLDTALISVFVVELAKCKLLGKSK
jgi:hypothetical protein